MLLVLYIDHEMSDQPTAHWHDGQLPAAPKSGKCWAMGWLTHLSPDWLQLLHVTTQGQHGHYSNIHRGSIRQVYVLEPVGVVGDE